MGLEASKKEEQESIIIEIIEYENIEEIMSKVIVPFSEVMGTSNIPDVYAGHEKIPFEKRYPLYQTIMRQEFADAMRALKNGISK
jgi:hypothetical protein